jgi:hypothetical protein
MNQVVVGVGDGTDRVEQVEEVLAGQDKNPGLVDSFEHAGAEVARNFTAGVNSWRIPVGAAFRVSPSSTTSVLWATVFRVHPAAGFSY